MYTRKLLQIIQSFRDELVLEENANWEKFTRILQNIHHWVDGYLKNPLCSSLDHFLLRKI